MDDSPGIAPLDVSPLFTPFNIRGLTVPNRFVLPGMQRQWCEDGRVLPRLREYCSA